MRPYIFLSLNSKKKMSMLLTTTGVAYIQYIIPLKGEQKAESKPWKSRESTKLHKQFFAWMSWLGKSFFCDSSFSFGSGSIMTKNGSYHYNWQNLCVVIELLSKNRRNRYFYDIWFTWRILNCTIISNC